jgi:indolepyruvate decarboxylase
VAGDFVLNFMDYIVASERLELITTCNELNAGYAADAYAKLRGMAAVCVTYNVGGLSLMNAVVGAAAESVPLIVISGAPARRVRKNRLLIHHTNGNLNLQLALYQQFCPFAAVINDPKTAGVIIDTALQACATRKQPVYLELPVDMVDEMLPAAQFPLDLAAKEGSSNPEKTAAIVDEVFKRVLEAQRPIILAGSEIPRFGLAPQLRKLIEASGLSYITTMGAKGVLEESHPAYLGTYAGTLFCSCAQKYLEQADFVLNLGAGLSDVDMTRRENLVLPGIAAKTGLIQLNDYAVGSIPLGELMQGLALKFYNHHKVSSGAIIACAAEKGSENCAFWQYKTDLGQRTGCLMPHEERPDAQLTVGLLFHEMRKRLTSEMIIVADVGEALLSSIELPVKTSGGYVSQPFYLSIGYSIPATLGAALGGHHVGQRIITLVGDGALQMTAQELSTIARYGLNPIIILLNNDGYAIERAIHDGPYNDIQRWQYHLLPQVFSDRFWCSRVQTPRAFAAAFEKALEHADGPSFIEAVLDPKAISQPLHHLGASLGTRMA